MSIIGDGIMLGAGGETASIFVTGLSETDTVTASKDGKTVVGKLTQKPNPAYRNLPDGYKQVYYIQNTGTASVSLINTWIYWGNISKIEYVINELTGSGGMVFSGGAGSAPWLTTDGRSSGITGLSHSFVNDGDSLTSFTDATNNPFCISGWTDTIWTGTYQYKTVRLYNKSNKLVYDGVPAQQISDNAVGLYDIVSKTFKSSGFTAGPEIPHTIDGFLIDKIKDYGTYTITATDGTKTATQDVLVDSAMQYDIELSYKLWLYRDGDECEDATGGWTSSNSNYLTIHKNNDNMLITRIYVPTAYYNLAKTSNIINLNGYTKIGVAWEGLTTNSSLRIGFASPSYKDESGYIVSAEQQTATSGEVVLVIPSLSEDCVVGIGIGNTTSSWTSGNKSVTIKRIWLE